MNRVRSPPSPLPLPPSGEQKDLLSQPQKKHKMNEEDDEHKMDEDEEAYDSSPSPYWNSKPYSDEENDKVPPREVPFSTYDTDEDEYFGTYDEELWDKYRQQVEESKGFDITDYPGQCFMTTVFPMPNYLRNPVNYEKLEDYARKALKEYNTERGTSYEVDKLLKVNGGGCNAFIYYLTFTVNNGEYRYFQAQVVDYINGQLDFPLTRPRPDQNPNVEAVEEQKTVM